jgi:hypothetical protein
MVLGHPQKMYFKTDLKIHLTKYVKKNIPKSDKMCTQIIDIQIAILPDMGILKYRCNTI